MGNEPRNMKKIVLIEKFNEETQNIQQVNKVILATGDDINHQGHENSTPTFFHRMENIQEYFRDGEIYFAGNIFKEHLCHHSGIRVFCNTNEQYGDGVEDTPAIVKFLNANLIKVLEEESWREKGTTVTTKKQLRHIS